MSSGHVSDIVNPPLIRVKRRKISGPACMRDDAGEDLSDRCCGILRIEPTELQWRPEVICTG
jgi:hypothetical protein